MKKTIILLCILAMACLFGCGGSATSNVTATGGNGFATTTTQVCTPNADGTFTCVPVTTTASATGGTVGTHTDVNNKTF